jgi:hypothetical protein
MNKYRAWVALLAGGAAASALPAAALAADAPVAVLGIEASEGAPDGLAISLTDALRQRITSTKGFRLVPGRDLVEVKLVFSCPDEAPSCMAQAGKSLGATKLIFGSVKKSAGESYVVTLKMLDANRGIVDGWVAEQITKAQASGPGIRGPVQKWFATLTGQGGAGVIKVRGDVIGASVAVDGTPSGTIGTDDLLIPGVTAGKHDVTITKPGYNPVRRDVLVASGETAQVEVTMPRSAGPPTATIEPMGGGSVIPLGPTATLDDRDMGSRTGLKTATWAVLGAGLVGVALGVKFGMDVQKINKDLDPYRRFLCNKSPTGVCDSKNEQAAQLTAKEVEFVKLKRDDGQRLETYQYISYGVGGALLVTSGYLFYKSYLQPEGELRASRSVKVAPVVTPTSVGAAAALTF